MSNPLETSFESTSLKSMRQEYIQKNLNGVLCDSCNIKRGTNRCSSCKSEIYCSSECAKNNWKVHKVICQRMKLYNEKLKVEEARILEKLATEENFRSEDDFECIICYESMRDNNSHVVLPCNHLFCINCLKTHTELRKFDSVCPQCAAQIPMNIPQYVYGNASLFLQHAKQFPRNSEARVKYCYLARKELEKFHALPQEIVDASISLKEVISLANVEISLAESNFDECINAANELMSYFENPVNNKDLDNDILYLTLCMSLGEAHLGKQENHNLALVAFKKAMAVAKDSDSTNIRAIFAGASQALYKFGKYDMALQLGLKSLQFNRHYEGCYEYVARSYIALGNIDEAIKTMEKATYYETPWDPVNVAKVRSIFEELIDLKINQQKNEIIYEKKEEIS